MLRAGVDLGTFGLQSIWWGMALFLAVYGWYGRWWRHRVPFALASTNLGVVVAFLPIQMHYWPLIHLSLTSVGSIWFEGLALNAGFVIELWRSWTIRQLGRRGALMEHARPRPRPDEA